MNSRPLKLLSYSSKKFNSFYIGSNTYKNYGLRLFSTSKTSQSSCDERILKGDTKLIKRLDAYLRLIRFDKQIGTKLLLLPCYWSICIAAPIGGLPSVFNLSLFTVGALCARSAGCIINDFWDSDIDKHVDRTKLRPITSGEISKASAMTFFSGLTATCFGIAYSLKPMVTMLGVLSVPLVISYPKFKRFFKHPQFMLGITFNYGVWMGYASIFNAIDYQILLPMYLGGICWTMIYDTIYAYQDIDDDKKLGLNSSAIQFQNNPRKAFTTLATLSSLCFGLTGYINLPALLNMNKLIVCIFESSLA